MKSVIYINRDKIWFDNKVYDWNWDGLDGIFSSIKKDLKINDVRIVLGSEVSYVVDFKLQDISKARRADVLKMTKGWLPFVVTDECFDWKMVKLGESDIWAQVIAVEPSFLESITKVITKSGVRVEWMIPVGIVLGMMSEKKEVPVIIKWKGKENLTVLAQNGLVDYVGKDSDETVNDYAKLKWHLEVNPEHILLNDDNFDLREWVDSGKTKGSDTEILGLNLLKNGNQGLEGVIPKSLEEIVGNIGTVLTEEQEVIRRKPVNMWLIILLVISVAAMVVVLGLRYWQTQNLAPEPVEQASPIVTSEVTPEATPSTVPVDLAPYKVQVLNGGGVAGEAGRLESDLATIGFEEIVVGNSPTPETLTLVSYKSNLPAEVLSKAMDTLKKYEIGSVLFLTNDQPYDLVIVIGSSVKNDL